MTRQVTPEQIPAIKVGAGIAYIVVLGLGIGFIESTVCDISDEANKFAVLFGIFAVAVIVPWLYTLVILGNLQKISRKKLDSKIKEKDKAIANVVDTLGSLVNQTPPDIEEIRNLLQTLQGQIHSLATSQQRNEARKKIVNRLNKKLFFCYDWKKNKTVREAAERGLKSFPRFSELSSTDKKKVEKGFNKDINECLNWLTISLKSGVKQRNTEGLKKSFTIQTTVRPYIVALEYIRDSQTNKYCKNKLETEEMRNYINLLIESL